MPKGRNPPFTRPPHHPYAVPSHSRNPQQPQAPSTQRQHQNNRSANPSQCHRPNNTTTVGQPKKKRSVGCWTYQHGTDPPRSYFSGLAWSQNQRRARSGTPEDKVPRIFRGCTVSEMSKLSEAAHVQPDENAVYCDLCGGLVLVQEQHEASRLHQSRLRTEFSNEPFDALVEDMLLNPGVSTDDGSEDGDDL